MGSGEWQVEKERLVGIYGGVLVDVRDGVALEGGHDLVELEPDRADALGLVHEKRVLVFRERLREGDERAIILDEAVGRHVQ